VYELHEDSTDLRKHLGVLADHTLKSVCNLCIVLVSKMSMNQSTWNEYFQNRLRVLEDRELRKIFVPTTDKEWRRIHNEELHDLLSPNIIR